MCETVSLLALLLNPPLALLLSVYSTSMASPAAQQPHQLQLQVATLADQPYDVSSYEPPMAVPLLLPRPTPTPTPTPTSVRRLPPPCWTPDETSCLIDSYRSKWLSLRRSNLRSNHWQDVADYIHSRCPDVSPPKTAVQCRHKMEKLRKRYRAELLRANSIPHHRFKSSWIYFSKMESIDKPSSPLLHTHTHNHTPVFISGGPTLSCSDFDPSPVGATPNYTPKSRHIPTPQSLSQSYNRPTPVNNLHHMSPNTSSALPSSNNYINDNKTSPHAVKGSKSKLDEAALQMADAIRMVGEGFVRMEHMKMDVLRETERLRVDMEMKRTQMLLDSQHRILQSFSQVWSDIFHSQHPSS